MEGFVVVLIVLGIISALAVVICIWFLIAKAFYRIACMKRFYEKKYLWAPFFLGIVGMLLVAALPTRYQNGASLSASSRGTLRELLKKTKYFSNDSEMIKYLRHNEKTLSGQEQEELEALLNLPEGKLRDEIKKRIGG